MKYDVISTIKTIINPWEFSPRLEVKQQMGKLRPNEPRMAELQRRECLGLEEPTGADRSDGGCNMEGAPKKVSKGYIIVVNYV